MREFRVNISEEIELSPEVLEQEIKNHHGVKVRDVGNGYVWYTLPSLEFDREEIILSTCFFQSRIQCIEISVSNSELFGESWADFSEDKEMARAKAAERWLESIGFAAGKYNWGEIWAGYEPKSGAGLAVVRYAL